MALRPRRGTWARDADAHTPVDAARALAWGGPDDPGDWQPVTRTFRDGHAETWWAADATLGGWGPDGVRRLVVATADPAGQGHLVPGHQPAPARRSPRSRQPAPSSRPGRDHPDLRHPQLDRAELQAGKDELGWADSRVRSDIAIRRHQALVNCAFSFCWDAWFHDHPAPHQPAAPRPGPGRGERGAARRRSRAGAVVAAGAARNTRLAFPLDRAATLVACMVHGAPATAAAGPDELGRGRLRPAPLHPELTNYR